MWGIRGGQGGLMMKENISQQFKVNRERSLLIQRVSHMVYQGTQTVYRWRIVPISQQEIRDPEALANILFTTASM